VLGEVLADAERAAGAGDQHGADGVVVADLFHHRAQVPPQGGGQPGPLQGDRRDAAGILPGHRVGHRRPASSPSSIGQG
jgi:hypothetical protein